MPAIRILLSTLCIALSLPGAARAGTLLVAVAPAVSIEAGCGQAGATPSLPDATLPARLAAEITRHLHEAGAIAVVDSTLGSLLLRLDRVSPDPYDYRRTREHVTASGAARLVYVNDLRFAADAESGACAFSFGAATWNATPFTRRAYTTGSIPMARDPGSEAARRVAAWILENP